MSLYASEEIRRLAEGAAAADSGAAGEVAVDCTRGRVWLGGMMHRSLQLGLVLLAGVFASAGAEPVASKERSEVEARKRAEQRDREAALRYSPSATEVRAQQLQFYREYLEMGAMQALPARRKIAMPLIEELLNVEVRIVRPLPGVKLAPGDIFTVSRFDVIGMLEICAAQTPAGAAVAALERGDGYELRRVFTVKPEAIRDGLRDGSLKKLTFTESVELRVKHGGIVGFYHRMMSSSNFLAKKAWAALALAPGEVFTVVSTSEEGLRCQIVELDGTPGRQLPLLQLTQLDEAVEKGYLGFIGRN